jgi:hypothetical protein
MTTNFSSETGVAKRKVAQQFSSTERKGPVAANTKFGKNIFKN